MEITTRAKVGHCHDKGVTDSRISKSNPSSHSVGGHHPLRPLWIIRFLKACLVMGTCAYFEVAFSFSWNNNCIRPCYPQNQQHCTSQVATGSQQRIKNIPSVQNTRTAIYQSTTRLTEKNNHDTAGASSKLITKKGKEAAVEYKDFWGTSIRSTEVERPPYVPTLDPLWGSLPTGAYEFEADKTWDPKPTCQIALDLPPITAVDSDHYIAMVQQYTSNNDCTA